MTAPQHSSTTFPWSNAMRNCSVDTSVTDLTGLVPLVATGELGVPQQLVVDTAGWYVIGVGDKRSAHLWEVATGKMVTTLALDDAVIEAQPHTFMINGNEFTWDGKPTFTVLGTGSIHRQVAHRMRGTRVMAVWIDPDVMERPYPVTMVSWADITGQPDNRGFDARQMAEFRGKSVAAFDAEDRAVIALDTGRLIVAERDVHGHRPITLVDCELGYVAYDLSIIDDTYYLVSHGDKEGSTLHALGADGSELWRMPIPFQLRQPPVRGVGGQLYLVGKGIAAVRDGTVMWQRDEPREYYATSDIDGRLLVSAGERLELLAPDGSLLAASSVRQGETITTPAAVSGWGQVYVGTQSRIYRATFPVQPKSRPTQQ